MKNKIAGTFFILICLMGFYSSLNGQCEGEENNGQPIILNTPSSGGSNTSQVVSVAGLDVIFSWDATTKDMSVMGTDGVMISSNTPGYAANVPPSTDITTLANYVGGQLIMYNTVGHWGEFGQGVNGFLALHRDGHYGWIELELCGILACNLDQYQFTIVEKGLSEAPKPGVLTGICPTLLGEPIPTLSQWSLILLSLLFLIFGTVAVVEKQKVYS